MHAPPSREGATVTHDGRDGQSRIAGYWALYHEVTGLVYHEL
jgi:hypothetical protein